MDENTVIEIENVRKKYRLGTIGGGTLRGELQSRLALLRGKADPNAMIGAERNYQKEFWALNGITFSVNRGERVGIIGHNGAGKSTLLKLLSRITAPTDGEMKIRGRITSMLEVGTGFHGELSGRENIYLNAAILGMKKEEVDAKIDDIIRFSECEEFIDTPVKRYSSGMYVKLAFSVAAHLNSEIMIMDEVLAVGDVNFQEKCLQKMREVSESENRTILYVSHNMNTIRKLCNRCIVLEKGKMVYDGIPSGAIDLYSGVERICGNKRHFSPEENERSDLITIDYFELISQAGVYKQDSTICAKLVVNNSEILRNIHVRCLIKYQDGTVAGTFFSEKISLLNAKKHTMYFELPIRSIPEGRFYIRVVIGSGDNFLTWLDLTAVERAAEFTVLHDEKHYLGINWVEGWRVNLGAFAIRFHDGEHVMDETR